MEQVSLLVEFFFIDQFSSFTANNNLRDGLRIEETTVRINNLSGLGPLIETKNNGRRGTSVGRNSFLDLGSSGPIRGLQSSNNVLEDLFLDFSSYAILRSCSIGKMNLQFRSQVDFQAGTTVSTLTCSSDSSARGIISCPP